MNQVFTGIDEAICRIAWQMVLPGIENAANNEITNKLAGCIVVLNPRRNRINHDIAHMPVLFMETINGPLDDEKYVQIALYKAFLTFRHRLPSAVVQQQSPYLYQEGDTKWGGSTIDGGGLIVAFSGVQAVFDEMIAEWMASAIRALCRWEMTKPGGVMSQDTSFIGE